MKPGFIIFVIVLVLLSARSWAQPVGDREQLRYYRYCTDLANRAPNQALSEAMSWRDLGGGLPALHCLAQAHFTLGNYQDAGLGFEAIANNAKIDPELRPTLFAQAGQAWLLAGDAARAEAAFDAAISLDPENENHLIDRARARAEMQDYENAVLDLNQAIELKGNNADALAYRASALRALDRDADALVDAQLALSINPNHLGALLERGILLAAMGRTSEARSDWLTILRLDEQSPEAQAARDRIEALDVAVN